jgi:hypothetical protein
MAASAQAVNHRPLAARVPLLWFLILGPCRSQIFLGCLFYWFGIPRRRVATFEQPVNKSDGHGGFIDSAFQQAKDYFPRLKDRDLPRYIVVSDFARFPPL